MPGTRRSIDAVEDVREAPNPKIPRKGERSHIENQERAYVAASRRADRSIEARVLSAKQASELHKRRTGKGFKISEEIVMKEEMYEEEEDDFPRAYRALTAQYGGLANKPLYDRLQNYVGSQVAVATLNYQNEINNRFAQQFPDATAMAQRLAASGLHAGLQHSSQQYQPGASASPIGNMHSQRPHSRTQSLSNEGGTPPAGMPPMRHTSIHSEGSQSPVEFTPSTTPGSDFHLTPQTQYAQTPQQFPQSPATTSIAVDPSLSMVSPRESSFTTQLPLNVQQLVMMSHAEPLRDDFRGSHLDEMIGIGYQPDFHFGGWSTDPVPEAAAFDATPIPATTTDTNNLGGSSQSSEDGQLASQPTSIGTGVAPSGEQTDWEELIDFQDSTT